MVVTKIVKNAFAEAGEIENPFISGLCKTVIFLMVAGVIYILWLSYSQGKLTHLYWVIGIWLVLEIIYNLFRKK
jgi:hypothetical protein